MLLWPLLNRIRGVLKNCFEERFGRSLRPSIRTASTEGTWLTQSSIERCTFKSWWGSSWQPSSNSKRKSAQLALTVHSLTSLLDNHNPLGSLGQLRCLNNSNFYSSKQLSLLALEHPKEERCRRQVKLLLHQILLEVSLTSVETPQVSLWVLSQMLQSTLPKRAKKVPLKKVKNLIL